MGFIDKYNKNNFNQLLSSLINFNSKNKLNNNIHLAIPRPRPKSTKRTKSDAELEKELDSERLRKEEEEKLKQEQLKEKEEQLKKEEEELKQEQLEEKEPLKEEKESLEEEKESLKENIINTAPIFQSTESTNSNDNNQSSAIIIDKREYEIPNDNIQPNITLSPGKKRLPPPNSRRKRMQSITNELGIPPKNNPNPENTPKNNPNFENMPENNPNPENISENNPNSKNILENNPNSKNISENNPNSKNISENNPNLENISENNHDLSRFIMPTVKDMKDTTTTAQNIIQTILNKDHSEIITDFDDLDTNVDFNTNTDTDNTNNDTNNDINTDTNNTNNANNTNDTNTDEFINGNLQEIQNNVQETNDNWMKLFTQPKTFTEFVSFEDLDKEEITTIEHAIAEEDESMEKSNTAINNTFNERAPDEPPIETHTNITSKDIKILNSLTEKDKINTTVIINNETGNTATTTVDTIVKDLASIEIGHENAALNEVIDQDSKTKKTKILRRSTSFESELEQYNDKIKNNEIKSDINQFTNLNDLKDYILQQGQQKNLPIEILNTPINNIYTLSTAVSMLYDIAFDNQNKVISKNAVNYNIKNIINNFIRKLYIDMFQPNNFYNKNNFNMPNSFHELLRKGEDPLTHTIKGFIEKRLNNPNADDFKLSITGKNNTPITLNQLMHTCSMLYTIHKQNNELLYNTNKSFNELLTEPLFELKKRNPALKSINITSESSDINILIYANKIIESLNKALTKLVIYTNNYCQNLKKLVTYKTDLDEIKDTTTRHHYFQRMSWKGFDIPLSWYATQIKNQYSYEAIAAIEKVRNVQKVNTDTINLYNDRGARLACVYVYQKFIVPYLLKDIQTLKRALNWLNRYQFTNQIYNQLYTDYKEKDTVNFFRTSRIFNTIFNPDNETVKIEWLDPKAQKNQQFIKANSKITAKYLNNRILLRIAANLANDDELILSQFYQQSYAKYLISLLCNTTNLGRPKQWSWQYERGDITGKTYTLTTPKLSQYIKKYLSENTNQLTDLQTEIINTIKAILHNNNNLFNILPDINLLTSINLISTVNITQDSYDSIESLYAPQDKNFNSAPDLIKYIMWYFSRKQYDKNPYIGIIHLIIY